MDEDYKHMRNGFFVTLFIFVVGILGLVGLLLWICSLIFNQGVL